MSLSSALSTAMSGLRANQAALAIVSSNISNSQTPGYVTQGINQVEMPTGDNGSSVRVTGVNRQLDQFVQTQLWTETSGGAYADQMSNILTQLQSVYGTPGGNGTLETAFSNLTTSLQALSASSGSPSAQTAALTAAQTLAQQLNATTQGIQSLRSNAEQDLAVSVSQVNDALNQVAGINLKLGGLSPTDPAAATLLDQRDNAIGQISKLMDVKVVTNNLNQASIYTTTGIQLVGTSQASQLIFNSQGTLGANDQWSSDPTKSGVGTLMVKYADGTTNDLIAGKSINSGQIGADLKLRDQTLVQAQAQVDQLAAALASSVSDQTTAGTPVSAPPKNGFTVDLSNVQPGNTINLTYTDAATNTQHQVSIVRVDDPAALPLTPPPGSNPNNKLIGINFTGGMASVVTQLTAALGGASLQFTNPAGSTLQVVDNGLGSATVNAASVTKTATGLTNGSAALPLFTDASNPYTGAITVAGSQQTGLAGRITVNAQLLSNPSRMTVYNTSPLTTAGDTTRADYLFSQLTSGTFAYAPQTGLGSAASPFKGTITSYMQQFLSLQGNAATTATQLQQGQAVVVNTLQQKFNSTAGVNIDTEMSNLIALQNTYAANAHLMSVVQSMMTTLLQVQV